MPKNLARRNKTTRYMGFISNVFTEEFVKELWTTQIAHREYLSQLRHSLM